MHAHCQCLAPVRQSQADDSLLHAHEWRCPMLAKGPVVYSPGLGGPIPQWAVLAAVLRVELQQQCRVTECNASAGWRSPMAVPRAVSALLLGPIAERFLRRWHHFAQPLGCILPVVASFVGWLLSRRRQWCRSMVAALCLGRRCLLQLVCVMLGTVHSSQTAVADAADARWPMDSACGCPAALPLVGAKGC